MPQIYIVMHIRRSVCRDTQTKSLSYSEFPPEMRYFTPVLLRFSRRMIPLLHNFDRLGSMRIQRIVQMLYPLDQTGIVPCQPVFQQIRIFYIDVWLAHTSDWKQ